MRYNGEGAEESWTWSDFWHFLELKPDVDASALEAKFPAFSDRYFRGMEVTGSKEIFTLQPLKDAHLYSAGLEYEIGRTANGKGVWSLLIIAFFILVIAWINYVNLSSVRAIERAKEVGVRKVVGAKRSMLVEQFLTEVLLVNVLATLLAWQGAELIKPWFAKNFGLESSSLHLLEGSNFYLLLTMLGLVLAGVLISGFYPAWLLSFAACFKRFERHFSKKNSEERACEKGWLPFNLPPPLPSLDECRWCGKQSGFHAQPGFGHEHWSNPRGGRYANPARQFAFRAVPQRSAAIITSSKPGCFVVHPWRGGIFH